MPTPDNISSQLADIQRTLGTLLGESKRAEEDRKHANEHRNRIHERVDELREEMDKRFAHTDESIAISGAIAAQARDSVASVRKLVEEDIKPETDQYRRMRTMGSGFVLAVALGAGALGITFASFIKAFLAAASHAVGGR